VRSDFYRWSLSLSLIHSLAAAVVAVSWYFFRELQSSIYCHSPSHSHSLATHKSIHHHSHMGFYILPTFQFQDSQSEKFHFRSAESCLIKRYKQHGKTLTIISPRLVFYFLLFFSGSTKNGMQPRKLLTKKFNKFPFNFRIRLHQLFIATPATVVAVRSNYYGLMLFNQIRKA
jgi:hypothetical protein